MFLAHIFDCHNKEYRREKEENNIIKAFKKYSIVCIEHCSLTRGLGQRKKEIRGTN
jgi:hypothetical protein